MSDLIGNPEDRFSQNEAHIICRTAGEVTSDRTKDEFGSQDWQRVIIVLESVQNKKKILNFTVLVPVCFQLIAR